MVKNFKLLIVAIGLFGSVQAQDTTKAVVKIDSVPPLPGNYFFGLPGSLLQVQFCESPPVQQ